MGQSIVGVDGMAAPPIVHSVQRHLRSGDDRVGPRRRYTAAKVALTPPLQLAASIGVSSCLCRWFFYRGTSDAIITGRREQTGRAMHNNVKGIVGKYPYDEEPSIVFLWLYNYKSYGAPLG